MVISEILDWARNVNHSRYNPRFFWLHGMAGEGKTTIATSIACQLDDEKLLGACFFFSRDIDDRSRPDKVFSTIVFQLAHRYPCIARAVSDVLEVKPDAGHSSVTNQCHDLIMQLCPDFEAHLDPDKPIVIVLDALDECGTEKDRKDLLAALKLLSELPSMFKIFLSCRPEQDIGTTLRSIVPSVQQCDLSSGTAKRTVDQDIAKFIGSWVDQIRRLYPESCWSEAWPGDEKLRLLVGQTGNLFIWAATAMKFIEDEEVGDPIEQLDILLDNVSSLPESPSAVLDRLYLNVLQRAYTAKASIRRLALFQRVVGAVLAVRNPLPPSTLGDLLNLSDASGSSSGPIYDAVAKLRSVLFLPDRHQELSQPVRTIHPSFGEFLASKERSGTFSVNPLQSHADLLSSCLETLIIHMQHNCLCNGALLYARQNWCYHFHYVLVRGGGGQVLNFKSSGTLIKLLRDLLLRLSSCTPEAVHWLLFMRDVRDDLRQLISQLKVINILPHSSVTKYSPISNV
jgi:NACHT domain